MVYPPPPRISRGRFCFLMKLTHSAWPGQQGGEQEDGEGREGERRERREKA